MDASVVLKWIRIEEVDAQQATVVFKEFHLRKTRLAIPHYAYAEIANILGLDLSREVACTAFSYLLGMKLDEYPITLEVVSVATELMEKYKGVSFYDAGYHAIALLHGGTFITADEKYYQKTRKEGSIMLLKDYGKKR